MTLAQGQHVKPSKEKEQGTLYLWAVQGKKHITYEGGRPGGSATGASWGMGTSMDPHWWYQSAAG